MITYRAYSNSEYQKQRIKMKKLKKKRKIKKALSSHIANIIVDEAQYRANNKYTTLFDD